MKRAGLVALALVVLVATSAHWATAVDKYTAGTVGDLVVVPNGDFVFHLEGFPVLCNQTPTGDGREWVTVTGGYTTADGKKALLAIVTSAKLTGRPVQVRGLNNATAGEWGCRLEAVDFL
jgi:hypothetical protein